MSTSKKSEDETKVAGNTASTTHPSVATDVDGITQARNIKRYHALRSFEKAFRSKEDSSMIKTPASRTLIAAISGASQSISAPGQLNLSSQNYVTMSAAVREAMNYFNEILLAGDRDLCIPSGVFG